MEWARSEAKRLTAPARASRRAALACRWSASDARGSRADYTQTCWDKSVPRVLESPELQAKVFIAAGAECDYARPMLAARPFGRFLANPKVGAAAARADQFDYVGIDLALFEIIPAHLLTCR
jgi:hypothetical protein